MRAVRKGGIIRFRCGPDPVRIELEQTAKVVNTSRRVVLDGRGRVTLSGGGERRILYQNTCDPAQTWTTSHCDDQARPRLVVQDLTLADGDATGETYDGGGGGVFGFFPFAFAPLCCFFCSSLEGSGVSGTSTVVPVRNMNRAWRSSPEVVRNLTEP